MEGDKYCYFSFLIIAPGDYTSDLYTVVIPAGSTTAVLMVQTRLDGIPELPETFTATIVEACDRVVPGNPSKSYVQILDSDSKFV